MCCCTFRRISAISRWAAFERSCVSANEVPPWIDRREDDEAEEGHQQIPCWVFPIMSSIRNFVEAGRTSPETRLIGHQEEPESRGGRGGA